MPSSTLFWIAAALVVIGQIMILRSTVRAMRGAASERARRGIEWSYAIVPVIALAFVLVATWRAAERHQARGQAISQAASQATGEATR